MLQHRGVIGNPVQIGSVVIQRSRHREGAGIAEVIVGTADQIDALGGGIHRIGEVAATINIGEALGRQKVAHSRATQVFRKNDAITHFHVIGIQGDAPVVGRLDHQTQTEVGRFLGVQRFGTQCLSNRAGHRERAHIELYTVDEVGGGSRIQLLRQRRRTETVADGATQRDALGEGITRGQLARQCGTEVGIILITRGEAGAQLVAEVGIELDIPRPVVACLIDRIAGTKTGEHLRATAGKAFELARLDLVGVAAILDTGSHIERIRQADIEATGKIEIHRSLLVLQGTGEELGRAGRTEAGVVAVANIEIELVTAVAHAQIKAPASGIAAKTAECGHVIGDGQDQRQEAFRMNLRHIAGIKRTTEESRRIALAAAVVGEAVELDLLAQRQHRVDEQHLILHRRIAKTVIDAIKGGLTRVRLAIDQRKLLARVGARTVGVVAVTVFGGDGKEAAITEIETGKATDVVELAIALVEFAIAVIETGAAVRALEHDVDHTGNGIGTILRRRAIAQHFDAFDGAAGNGIEIDRRRTAAEATIDVDDGGSVAALAVDQHQCLIRCQTAQLRWAHMIGAIGDRSVGEVERRNGA